MNKLLDILIPRFTTRFVAVKRDGDNYHVVCELDQLRPDDDYDLITSCKFFNLFGFALFAEILVPGDDDE